MLTTRTIQAIAGQAWVEPLGWALVHFLWQGAAIAGIYVGARQCVGRSRAQARYLLACAALLALVAAPVVTFGLSGAPDSAPKNPYVGTVPLTSSAAASSAPLAAFAAGGWHDDVTPWLVVGWLLGATCLWVRLIGGCVIAARMRSTLVRPAPEEWQHKIDEIAERVRVSRPVRLLVSALVQVPTVVGWLRPVVLMPVGALAGLPVEHIEALLAHELGHIRRHDYLVNILQSLAEALLFYHPAVWWVSKHIRNEREHCCDHIAVEINGDALTYVRALAGMESARHARFNAALAANGGSLRERVERLLGIRAPSRPVSGPAAIAASGLIVLLALAAFAQTAAPKPAFEVASIKLSPPEYVGFQSYVKGETYTALTATVRNLVGFAYGLRDFQISGGPAWTASIAYNVSAKMGAATWPQQAAPMVQGLLAERFGLKFHRIRRNRPGYALVIDKNGPKLTESKNPRGLMSAGNKDRMTGLCANMDQLAGALASLLESPVADRTRLKGQYDFTVTWTPYDAAADSSGPSMFTALRETLGLRLEAVKNVPVDILVIDRVERPSEN